MRKDLKLELKPKKRVVALEADYGMLANLALGAKDDYNRYLKKSGEEAERGNTFLAETYREFSNDAWNSYRKFMGLAEKIEELNTAHYDNQKKRKR